MWTAHISIKGWGCGRQGEVDNRVEKMGSDMY